MVNGNSKHVDAREQVRFTFTCHASMCKLPFAIFEKLYICFYVIKSVKVLVVWTFSGKTKMMRKKIFICVPKHEDE